MKKFMTFSGLYFILLFSPSAFAEKYSNRFIEFELPLRWSCRLEGKIEYVCETLDEAKKKEAVIIFAAKTKTKETFELYQNNLKLPQTWMGPKQNVIKSEPKYSKVIEVGGHPWVDALFLNSEMPGFFTRYFATIKDKIAVLVTFSVERNKYQAYQGDMDRLLQSLKATDSSESKIALAPTAPSAAMAPEMSTAPIAVTPPAEATPPPIVQRPKKQSQDMSMEMVLGLALAFAGFLFWKRKKSQ